MLTACLNENEIVAFLAGALDAPSLDRVESHVDSCPSCRAWLSAAAGTPAREGERALSTRSLADGQRVADRYRIVRFIAAGGMGEVYEAQDEVLAMPVALKTVRQERTDDPDALERLRRELTLARQVTHPNVSRVYDVGLHRVGEEEVPFFTLELLSGETLAERLARSGRLSPEEARPLLEQLSAGLDAAHAVGVLHRDLKSHNIFLRTSAQGALQAVITDFGLARSTVDDGSMATGAGKLLGTPAYMAPEQVAGERVGPAADLYALGVVAFEMVTGTLPFRASTPLATAARRLTEKAPDARALVPELSPSWSRCLEALLQREPSARPPSAAAALALLAVQPPRSSPSRTGALAAALLLTLAAGAWLLLRARTGSTPGQVTAAAPAPLPAPAPVVESGRRRALAVLSFRSASAKEADAAWLSVAAAQMLSAELTASPGLRPVTPELLVQAERDLSLQGAAELSEAQLDSLRKALDLDLVLSGTVTVVGRKEARSVRLDLTLHDAALGSALARVSESGSEQELFACIARAGARLREALQEKAPSREEQAEARAQVPKSLEAARAYAEGTRALAVLDLARARARLTSATALEPTFAPGHAALAQTLSSLGMREQALPVAQRAYELSAPLPRAQRLTIEALYRATQRDWARAVELYRSLWTVFPDDLEHGLRLANAQHLSGSPKEALATLEQLRRLPSTEREDPRIELNAAWSHIRVPDFAASQRSAAKAGAQAEVRGARMLLARARMAEAEALVFLARRDEALALLDGAERIFQAVEDRVSQAKAKMARGHVLRDRGDMDAALVQYREAEALDRAAGDELNLATALGSQAVIWRRKASPKQALALNEQALALFQKHGSQSNVSVTLNNLGRVLEDLDEPEAATARYREAIALATKVGDDGTRTRALGSLGLLAADRGDVAQGRKAFEEILSLIPKSGDAQLEASALEMLIELLLQQGELSTAQERFAQRERLSQERKLEDEVERSSTRAQLSLCRGEYAQAEALARQVAEAWKARNTAGSELEARELLVRVLLEAGKDAPVKEELARLQALSGSDADGLAHGAWARMTACYEARLGDARLGLRLLEKLLEQKTLSAFRRHELTLALVHAQDRLGQKAAARSRLATLTEEARRQGFGIVVTRAEALRQKLVAPRGRAAPSSR